MPVYEYRCNNCLKSDSYFVRTMSDAVAVVCRHCGSQEMTRLVSKVAFVMGKDRVSRYHEEIMHDRSPSAPPMDALDQDDPAPRDDDH